MSSMRHVGKMRWRSQDSRPGRGWLRTARRHGTFHCDVQQRCLEAAAAVELSVPLMEL